MREDDLYCEDNDENKQFKRYHRLAEDKNDDSYESVKRERKETESFSPNYFDAIWEGRVR
jgi:hypothetical protein